MPRKNGPIVNVPSDNDACILSENLGMKQNETENSGMNDVYDELPSRTNGIYDLPKGIKLRHPEKLLNLKKKNNDFADYDTLPSRNAPENDIYDLPKRINCNNNNKVRFFALFFRCILRNV